MGLTFFPTPPFSLLSFFPEFGISPFSLLFSSLLTSSLSLFYSGKLFKGKDFYDLLYLSQQNHIVARI